MMCSLRRRLLPLSCLSLLLATPAAAQQVDEAARVRADAAYARGAEHYRAGEFAEAAAAFEEALAAVDDPALLWNIGMSLEKAGDLERARDVYTRFLAAKGGDPALRSKAGEALVRVGSKLATHQRQPSEVEQPTGEEQPETVAEPAEDQEPPAPAAAAGPDEQPAALGVEHVQEVEGPSPAGWILVGTGAAALAAGVGVLIAGDLEMSALADDLASGITWAEAVARKESADTLRVAGGVVAGVGALAAVGGLIVLLTTGGGDPRETVSFSAVPLRGGRGALLGVGGTY